MSETERPRCVRIEWLDSTMKQGWSLPTKDHDLRCFSVGYLVNEDDDQITVSASWAPEGGLFADPLTIPKVAVIARAVFEEFRDKDVKSNE